MLYMVIEEFRDATRCFQLMETDDRALLEEWMSQWRDLVEFEVVPVLASATVEDSMAARL